jgi:hypothetical protein
VPIWAGIARARIRPIVEGDRLLRSLSLNQAAPIVSR